MGDKYAHFQGKQLYHIFAFFPSHWRINLKEIIDLFCYLFCYYLLLLLFLFCFSVLSDINPVIIYSNVRVFLLVSMMVIVMAKVLGFLFSLTTKAVYNYM